MSRSLPTMSRKGVESPSVPKQAATWTEDDVRRMLALKLTVCQQVKPKETTKLYGIKQRLSAMRMRLDGSVMHHRYRREIERIPKVTAADCEFLSDVIKRVLDGERDAYKAFSLALLNRNPGNPRTPFMAAEYELCQRICPKRLHKAARLEIAARYRVSPARVSQARTKHRREITAWISRAMQLADEHRIPHELMLRHLSGLVYGQADWFIGASQGSTLNDTPPEHLFNVHFPVLLVKATPIH
jgi:hypothetical protein